MKKKILALVLAVSMFFQVMPIYASETTVEKIASGVCGEDLTWNLDSNYVLNISGSGMMDNYYDEFVDGQLISHEQPWNAYADKIVKIVMGDEITSVGMCAFEDLVALKEVHLSVALAEIGSSAFEDCESLSEIAIPAGVSKIDESAFDGCKNLKNVFVEEGNNSYFDIEGVLFSTNEEKTILEIFPEQKQVEEYTIPEGVTGVNAYAFGENDFLKQVVIPKSIVDGVGNYSGCNNLENIFVEEGNPVYADIEGVLFYLEGEAIILTHFPTAKQIQDYEIPAGVTEVEGGAFATNTSIKSITFPTDINYVGTWFFSEQLETINLYFKGNMPKIRDLQRELNEIHVYTPIGNTTWSEDAITEVFGDNTTWLTKEYEKKNIADCLDNYYWVDESGKKIEEFEIADGGIVTSAELVIKDGFRNLFPYITLNSVNWDLQIGSNEFIVGLKEGSEYSSEYTGTGTVVLKAYNFCGENVTCTLDETGTILQIRGSGEIVEEEYYWEYPWYNLTELVEKIEIESGITVLPSNAFNSMDNLKEVELPNTVTHIGEYAFSNCTSLETIKMPTSLIEIRKKAFSYCYSLKNIQLPATLEAIGEGAFYECSSLEGQVVIPEKITSIPKETFYNCSSIFEVIIPESVLSIGEYAFYGCDSLYDLTLPDSITRIEDCAFEYCYNWSNITLPKNVEYIGDYAFMGCTGFYGEWIVPASLTSIGEGAFSQSVWEITVDEENPAYYAENNILYNKDKTELLVCSLEKCGNFTVDEKVEKLGAGAFNGCYNLTNVILPDKIDTIPAWTFYGCTQLEYITLPENLKTIGAFAFEHTKVSNLELPDGTTTIGLEAFALCDNLISIIIPASMEFIGSCAFYMCGSLEEIYFEGSAPEIISNALEGVTATAYYLGTDGSWNEQTLRNYNGNITWISYGPCEQGHTTKLQNASEATCTSDGYTGDVVCSTCGEVQETGSTINKLGHDYATQNNGDGKHTRSCRRCTYTYTTSHTYTSGVCFCGAKMTDSIASGTCGADVTWSLTGEGVLTIDGTGAMTNWSSAGDAPWYSYRTKIKQVAISEGVTSIGTNAFNNCSNLTIVQIPDSVININKYAFTNCSKLEEVDLPENITEIGWYAFSYCSALRRIELPEKVTTIGQYAFERCTSLTEVVLNGTLTKLERNAFNYCQALKSITIPKSVTYIGDYAFGFCTALEEVCFEGNAPTFTNYSFSSSNKITAYYPASNTTWAESKLQSYGGTITWIAYNPCEENGHSYGEWSVKQEATFDEAGVKERTCAKCGAKETEAIEKLIAVARIGDEKYATVSEAIANANEGEETIITLLDNVTESITIPANKKIILDLNGFTLTNNTGQDTVVNKGDLGVIDGGEVSIFVLYSVSTAEMTDGKIINQGETTVAIRNEASATLYLISGTVQNTSSESAVAVENAGIMDMTEVKITGDIVTTTDGDTSIAGGTVEGNVYKAKVEIDGSYTILDNSDASSTIKISGGTFTEDISGLNTDNTIVVEKEDGTYGIQEVAIVTVVPKTDDGTSIVVNVKGGGSYDLGDTVVLIATKKIGFEFLGWYELSEDESDYSGDALSTELIYSFSAEGSRKFVAVYKEVGTATLKVNGADFKVNGGVTQMIYNYTQDFNIGTEITLTAGGENFAYWMNESNKIVSTEKEYTFMLSQTTMITVVYKNATEETAFVEFVSDYNQVLQAQNYDATSEIIMPNEPSKSGYIFLNWSMTEEDIREAIKNGETYIRVTPVYEKIAKTFNVIVVYDGDTDNSYIYPNVTGYEFMLLTAKTIAGRRFAYWSDAATNGNVLSMDEDYSLYVNKDVTIYAVYAHEDEEVQKIPTITMTNAYTSESDTGTKKVHFEATRNIPEGYSLVEHGILYGTSSIFGESDASDIMILGGSNVAKSVSSTIGNTGIYVLNVSIGNKVDTIVYARGYMILQNEATGEIIHIYSQIVSGCYNDLK